MNKYREACFKGRKIWSKIYWLLNSIIAPDAKYRSNKLRVLKAEPSLIHFKVTKCH